MEEADPAEQSFGASATNAAVTGLYAGLKLTGFALRVATDLATSVTKEAERNRIRNTAIKEEKASLVNSQSVSKACPTGHTGPSQAFCALTLFFHKSGQRSC